MSTSRQNDAGRARAAAVLLVLLQCATLAIFESGYVFAVLAGGAALASLWPRLRIEPRQTPHWLWFALLGIMLAIKQRVMPGKPPEHMAFFNTAVGYEAARFLIFLQVSHLYLRRPDGRLPSWLAGVACLSLILGMNIRLTDETTMKSAILCLAFVGGLALFALTNRRQVARAGSYLPTVAAVLVVGAGLALGAGTAALFRHYEGELERLLLGRTDLHLNERVSPGFGGRGGLHEISSWKQYSGEQVMLRITAESAPGYLRGMVFDTFQGSNWIEGTGQRVVGVTLSPSLSPLRPGEELYLLRDEPIPPGRLRTLDVWPDDRNGSRLFLPLEAVYVASTRAAVAVSGHDLAVRAGIDTAEPFTAYCTEQLLPQQLAPHYIQQTVAVDPWLAEELQPVADEVFYDCVTAAEKITAVTRYFRDHFEYALSPQPRRGQDALVAFLTLRHPAHCEYFATGGALLLRMAGVPTRYTTGFVASEWNDYGQYWVARRKDAHAWIEAYDDQLQRWVIVECTPPLGVPQSTSPRNWSAWIDACGHRYESWWRSLMQGGWIGVVTMGLALVTSVPGLTVLVIGLFSVWLWRGRRLSLRRSRRPAVVMYPRLQRQLRRGERAARRLGLERAPSETLTKFAARLRTAATTNPRASKLADWFEAYVQVRYGASEGDQLANDLGARLQT